MPVHALQLDDNIMTFLLAGHETTAAALCFALQLLSTHPQVQARVVEEVRAQRLWMDG